MGRSCRWCPWQQPSWRQLTSRLRGLWPCCWPLCCDLHVWQGWQVQDVPHRFQGQVCVECDHQLRQPFRDGSPLIFNTSLLPSMSTYSDKTLMCFCCKRHRVSSGDSFALADGMEWDLISLLCSIIFWKFFLVSKRMTMHPETSSYA